jgi:hypothetical protein
MQVDPEYEHDRWKAARISCRKYTSEAGFCPANGKISPWRGSGTRIPFFMHNPAMEYNYL